MLPYTYSCGKKRACTGVCVLSGLLLSYYSLTTCITVVAVAFGAAGVAAVCAAAAVAVKGGGTWCDAYLCVRLLVADVVSDRS